MPGPLYTRDDELTRAFASLPPERRRAILHEWQKELLRVQPGGQIDAPPDQAPVNTARPTLRIVKVGQHHAK